jgi:CheY-like chemotaxis protein
VKLLIVDDSASVRRVIRILIAGIADDIYECANGTEALTLYSAERPDVVLMDIQMGHRGMDGITAARHIRAAYPAARIIMVTDYDQSDLREAAREAGACGYVVKDNLPELVGLLR